MPRPLRIEYENAFYHVLNRGRDQQTIFHDNWYYDAFLDILDEAHRRFQLVVHAYCLMGNHYHLLIETPMANLSRIMRHINGVYTQRHNRLKQTDGPLFRGRFKAILVDKDAYLLQLSRYIHRNPIDTQSPLVTDLVNYRWSSYPAYVAKAKGPAWLHRETTYGMLGHKQRYKGYASYIMQGVDDDTMHYYQRNNLTAIIGNRDFKAWVYNTLLPELKAEEKSRVLQPNITMKSIIEGVASIYGTTPDELRTVIKGPQKGNDARKIAMYLCQELANAKLKDIAEHFNLGHVGSVSFITHQVRKMKREVKVFARQIDEAIMSIMKNAT